MIPTDAQKELRENMPLFKKKVLGAQRERQRERDRERETERENMPRLWCV
jgi:hypothetical protein